MKFRRITITLPPETYRKIERRVDEGQRSAYIAQALDRYFGLMHYSRDSLKNMFTDNELGLIVDALNGVYMGDESSLRLVWAAVQDAVKIDKLDEKWGVDGPTVVRKLEDLKDSEYASVVALIDAIESWWATRKPDEPPTIVNVFEGE